MKCIFCHEHFLYICFHLDNHHLSKFSDRSFKCTEFGICVYFAQGNSFIVTKQVNENPQLLLLNISDMKYSEKSLLQYWYDDGKYIGWNDTMNLKIREFNYSCIACGKIYESGIPSMELVTKHITECMVLRLN